MYFESWPILMKFMGAFLLAEVALAEPTCSSNTPRETGLSLADWTYIQVDDSRGQWGKWDQSNWLRYIGLDMADVTGDGYQEIVDDAVASDRPSGRKLGDQPKTP